ncbi:cytochrome P450 [Geodermatophilus sp. DF01-2]|uniref:cytochrome P450 n=1 Tax=Geodermatophilus sp. DF01-2 TaxID=2559610 RepID=UPI001073CDA1|nr:cytochrome P450 [Geodermatophilus sp. DF01_2]TFV55843.1 cytochrome P450 [Geodermatophilus sp. DF01_2]
MSAAKTPQSASTDARPRCPVDIDLVNPDTFLAGMPLGAFARMREEAPVFWHPQPGASGDGFWAVNRPADIREVSRQPDIFSSRELGSLLQTGEQAGGDSLETMRLLLLNMDPPEHTRLRETVQRAFTPRTIRGLEPRLREFAEGIVDRAVAKGEGDFVKDVAAELPLLAICELMGIPAQDRGRIFDLSNRLIGFEDPEFQTSPEDAQVASTEMYLYANELAEQRQREPRQDIITDLLHAQVDGHALSVSEFDVFFLLLAVAGNETTRNAITHGMKAFFDHPEQWELFKRERPGAAADEIIRWATPVMQFQRTAMSDYVLAGQQIRAGERVGLFYSAANRDSDLLPEPDRFDIRRTRNLHVAFGGGGPHFCLGANLARAEVQIMFEVIADRMPHIAPTGALRPLRSMFINGIKTFPVRYVPAPPA